MASRTATLTFFGLALTAAPLAGQRFPVALQADVAASHIYVVTHRTGLLSFFGHEHAILAQKWTADLCWDEPAHTASRATLVVDTRTLEIDTDSARALAGIGKGPSASQRTQIAGKLHAAIGLDTQQYPEIGFASTRVVDEGGGKLKLHGILTIKGASREVEIPVTVQRRSGDEFWFTGDFTFRQSSFGIRPESIAGVVKVADNVDIHVRLLTRATDRCK